MDRNLDVVTAEECHPSRSGSAIVLVEDATEAVTAVDAQVGGPARVGDLATGCPVVDRVPVLPRALSR
jgi:hypothetical protein